MVRITGWVCSPQPLGSIPSPHCPGPITQRPSLLLVLVRLPQPGCKGLAPVFICRGQDCGPKRISEGHILRFPVSGPGPSSCKFIPSDCELIEEKCSPWPRQPAGARETAQTHPYPPPCWELGVCLLQSHGNNCSDCPDPQGSGHLGLFLPL